MKIVALLIFLWLNLISTLNIHTTRCRSNISASSVQGLHSPIKVFFPSSFLALLAPSPFFGVCVCVCVCVSVCVCVCVFIEFVTILLLFYVLVFWPGGMWDLSFPEQGSNLQPFHWKAKS